MALSLSEMSPLNRYTTLFWAKNIPPVTAQQRYLTNTQTQSLIRQRLILFVSVLHLIPNWENFSTKFWTTLSSAFCNKQPESLAHLLSRCKVSSEFWKEVLSWLKENNLIIDSFNEIGLFLGIFEESEDFLLNTSGSNSLGQLILL